MSVCGLLDVYVLCGHHSMHANYKMDDNEYHNDSKTRRLIESLPFNAIALHKT